MTTIGDPRGDAPPGVPAAFILVTGLVVFAALSILGLGMLSYFADFDILAVPGLDWWPGIIGMIIAIGAFAWMLWPSVSRGRASFLAIVPVALVAAVAHVAAVWIAALISGAGTTAAFAAVAQLVTRGSSLVVLAAALIAAWIGIALRRSQGRAPRWPWERDGDAE